MAYIGDDYSNDYDYAPRGMDDEDFHMREQRENAEALAHENRMDLLRMEEEAKWEDPWPGQYYPLNMVDDYDAITELNHEIQNDGIDDLVYCHEDTSEQVLELVEASSDEVKVLFYAMTSERDYSELLDFIFGNKYFCKPVCEARYLVAMHEFHVAQQKVLSFMSPPQQNDIPF